MTGKQEDSQREPVRPWPDVRVSRPGRDRDERDNVQELDSAEKTFRKGTKATPKWNRASVPEQTTTAWEIRACASAPAAGRASPRRTSRCELAGPAGRRGSAAARSEDGSPGRPSHRRDPGSGNLHESDSPSKDNHGEKKDPTKDPRRARLGKEEEDTSTCDHDTGVAAEQRALPPRATSKPDRTCATTVS